MTAQTLTLPGVLSGLLRDRGTGLLDDRRRLLGLLRDRMPAEVRAIRILMMAYDQGVAARLKGVTVSSVEVGREGTLLASETGLSLDIARQAVETWATALGDYVPAAVAPGPASAALGGARPSVERLPPRPTTAAASTTAASAAAASTPARPTAARPPKRAWLRRWPAIVLGLAVMAGGVMQIVKAVSPPAPPPPQPAPQPAPSQPPGAAARLTPEGIPAISREQPYPTLATERIKDSQKKDNPNTLGVYFGVPVDQEFVSYYVGYAFDKGQQNGKGIVNTLHNKQKATTDVIDAARVVETETGKSFLRIAGPFTTNAGGAPGVCVFAEVTGKRDLVEPVSDGLFAVFGLNQAGDCDMDTPYGFGHLK